MGRKAAELRNCANCLHCKQSMISNRENIFAFCDIKKKRNDQPLGYWNKKSIYKKLVDMRD
jgi:ribosomal protein L34E